MHFMCGSIKAKIQSMLFLKMLSQYIAHSQLITDSYIYFHHARKKISLKRTKGRHFLVCTEE